MILKKIEQNSKPKSVRYVLRQILRFVRQELRRLLKDEREGHGHGHHDHDHDHPHDRPPKPPKQAKRLLFFDEQHKEITMVTINAGKKRSVTVQPVDAQGNPAPVDGVPEWSAAPDGGVSLFPSADGMSCDIVHVAPMAGIVVTVKADARIGPDVKEIFGTLDIQTLSAEAASFTMTVSEETDA